MFFGLIVNGKSSMISWRVDRREGISVFLKKKQNISSSELCLLFNGGSFSYLQQHFSLYLWKGKNLCKLLCCFFLIAERTLFAPRSIQ
jgi:hypothetical protein